MAITFGSTSAPQEIEVFMDSLFTTSLANYRATLTDNIGATNAVIHRIMKSDAYEEASGGTYITEPLMYALAPSDSYDGYDELSTMPVDGISEAIYEWRQTATPIAYSMKQVIQNQHKIIDLVKAKIQQSEMGAQEGWAQAFMFGSADGSSGHIYESKTSTANGSANINPLGMIISYNTSGSSATALKVGGLDENKYKWWANHSKASAATTYSDFIFEVLGMYNTCALGVGGPPDLILCDQVTWQLFTQAYFSVYKTAPGQGNNLEFPFEWVKFFQAAVVMDDKVPDAYSDTIGTLTGGVVDSSTLTYGTMYFVNTKFFKIRYYPQRNFVMLKDENGKTFAKPINGDSRVGHISWMGNVTCNNRRKQGVLAKIPRTLTA
ncbi:MAG: phage major capsid protein [Candidatus Saccharimonadales bacterium]